jgi:hypothetical protein
LRAEGKGGKIVDASTTAPDDTGNRPRLARTIFPNGPGALHTLQGLVGIVLVAAFAADAAGPSITATPRLTSSLASNDKRLY